MKEQGVKRGEREIKVENLEEDDKVFLRGKWTLEGSEPVPLEVPMPVSRLRELARVLREEGKSRRLRIIIEERKKVAEVIEDND